jgi:hypothetical protein
VLDFGSAEKTTFFASDVAMLNKSGGMDAFFNILLEFGSVFILVQRITAIAPKADLDPDTPSRRREACTATMTTSVARAPMIYGWIS